MRTTEHAIVFGQYEHLVGVANIVESESEDKLAMMLLTPGMLHNVGPFRMYVDIANSLAAKGISSLRFDLSGIGESLGVGTTGKSIERAAKEAGEAMDYLAEHHGIRQFILFGLCSGADDSVQTALQDKRVKGVIALDGLGYATPKSRFNQKVLFARKMLRLSKWINKVKQVGGFNPPVPVSLAMGQDVREFPDTVEQACKELQQLVDRGTQLHFIYTGGMDYYNYAEQFYEMLPGVHWKGTESSTYFPEMDHVAMLCEDRQKLVEHICDKSLEMATR